MAPPFLLVHGAWHSAACWRPLVDELERRGEVAVAVDLPADDPAATLEDYAEAAVAAVAHLDEPVIVVGHSLGGITIPLVAERRPVAGLVFVAAVLASPGELPTAAMVDDAFSEGYGELSAADLVADDDGATSWRRDGAVAAFYHDLDGALLDEAVAGLRRQFFGPVTAPWPLAAYPDVPMRYIACTDDRILDPGWQLRTTREVLGIEADLLHCSHSPMLSVPEAMADLLLAPFA
jgi:pimeloyl-ACP methyl ester carboxylesterase